MAMGSIKGGRKLERIRGLRGLRGQCCLQPLKRPSGSLRTQRLPEAAATRAHPLLLISTQVVNQISHALVAARPRSDPDTESQPIIPVLQQDIRQITALFNGGHP